MNNSSLKKFFMDTVCFIYYFEDVSPYAEKLAPYFTKLGKEEIIVYTSTITLLESMVKPYQKGNDLDIMISRENFRMFKNLTVIPIDENIALKAAKIRAEYKYKTPDAIQLAAACLAGAEVFLTNDRQLLAFSELKVICIAGENTP